MGRGNLKVESKDARYMYNLVLGPDSDAESAESSIMEKIDKE